MKKTTLYYCYNNKIYYPSTSKDAHIKNELSLEDKRISYTHYKDSFNFGLDLDNTLFLLSYRPRPKPHGT